VPAGFYLTIRWALLIPLWMGRERISSEKCSSVVFDLFAGMMSIQQKNGNYVPFIDLQGKIVFIATGAKTQPVSDSSF
jgi:hypothetical protein